MDELTVLLDLRDSRIEELEKISAERVAAIESLTESYKDLKKEAELRREGLVELTEHVAVRDRRIRDLEEIAVERYKALQAQSREYQALQVEADRRTAGLVELTQHVSIRDEIIRDLARIGEECKAGLENLTAQIAARDKQILEWQQAAEERLLALQEADKVLRDLGDEVAKQSGLRQNAEQSANEQHRIAEERLEALLATDAALQAERADSELRLRGLEELTRIIAARDLRIEEAERTAADRLKALLATDAAREAAQKQIEVLQAQVIELEKQAEGFAAQIVALNQQNLYNFLVRRAKGLLAKPNQRL
jgi:chromosome segregation ATPase